MASAKRAVPKNAPPGPEDLIKRLPSHIRVGPYDILFNHLSKEDEEKNDINGQFCGFEEAISLGTFRTTTRLVDVLIHEVTHAIFWVYDLNAAEGEEKIVGMLGTAWAQVYRDNPWLLEWIGLGVLAVR
jgi:hypothetical protein